MVEFELFGGSVVEPEMGIREGDLIGGGGGGEGMMLIDHKNAMFTA